MASRRLSGQQRLDWSNGKNGRIPAQAARAAKET